MQPLPRLDKFHPLPTRSDRQAYRKDLTKITLPELIEILNREEKLLKNKAKLEKLPDKGQKIRDYYQKVQNEILKRDGISLAAEQFSQLNIASVGKKALDNLEWTGKLNMDQEVAVDSDDEDDPDPLKVIARSNELNKIVKVEKSDPLITEEDMKEIESFKEEKKEADKKVEVVEVSIKNKKRIDNLITKMDTKVLLDENKLNEIAVKLEPHALYLCEKELLSTPLPKAKFLPGRTTRTDVHNPVQEMKRHNRHNWEATAATPPLLRHEGVKALSLQESIEAQKRNFDQLKKVQAEQANQRLALKELNMRYMASSTSDEAVHFSDYRDKEDPYDEIDSEEEVLDEDVERGGIIYDVEK